MRRWVGALAAVGVAAALGNTAAADDRNTWQQARGFSAVFGSAPGDGVALLGASLEYTRRHGRLLGQVAYSYALLQRTTGVEDTTGVMHRGRVALRVPIVGVGPRFDNGFNPGTFFFEAAAGHHWNRWRDGEAGHGFDGGIAFGLMLSGDGARTLLAAAKVELIVARTDHGPDLICAAAGESGCTAGRGDLGVGVIATWGVSLGD